MLSRFRDSREIVLQFIISRPTAHPSTYTPHLIQICELESAIGKFKYNKAGCDGIQSEVIKYLDDRDKHLLLQICQMIWDTCQWLEDWMTSVIMPLHKKGSMNNCDNYRLISLISHASKVMLYIIHARLEPFISQQISTEQTGFVKGKGTREQILNIRQLNEKAREFYVPLYFCLQIIPRPLTVSTGRGYGQYSKAWTCLST